MPGTLKISQRTISALGKVVTGDGGLSPYRSGPVLVKLFNEYGFDDFYPAGGGFPSRWVYAEDKIRALNDTAALGALIQEVLDPREFLETDHVHGEAVESLNKWLQYDGFEVVLADGVVKIRDLEGVAIECRHPFAGSEEDAHLFIDEQIQKIDQKIQEGDYDGAITNARSLLEAVLGEIEKQIDPNPPKYDGDLPKLYKRVQKALDLHPGRADLATPLKQVLTGMVSIISGIAGLSNKMGDRHARSYRPAKHHALLVANAAKTMVTFLFDTHRYQAEQQAAPRPRVAR